MSYEIDCESCGESISAAARYCPNCRHEQERAVTAIARMRETDPAAIRTDGGDVRDQRVMPLWLWWAFVVAISAASLVVIWAGGGAL